MIVVEDGVVFISTARTSYWFLVTEFGHLEHLYYGPRLDPQDPTALRWPRQVTGSAVDYDAADPTYSLNSLPLEFSGIGQGDYRHPPIEVLTDHGYDLDLTYTGHEIRAGSPAPGRLPLAHGAEATTLTVTLADPGAGIEVGLEYVVYAATDVIARRTLVTNTGTAAATIEKVASLQVDLPHGTGWDLTSFDGAWIREAHRHTRPIGPGITQISSTTGSSSNLHNPGFLLSAPGAGEDHGRVVGVNLIYSGSHLSSVETGGHLVRVTTGIQPQAFAWPLAPGETFASPQAVLTTSAAGFNGVSANFHDFVNAHILPAKYQGVARPVVFNSWEAISFDVSARRVATLAKSAAALGMELFVIDDGWFSERGDDTGGLGNYDVDRKKFPGGLGPVVAGLKKLGLRAGLWFEPEMTNERSALYRDHPDWVLRTPGAAAQLGRNQLVLDLCNPQVCDYLVEAVGAVLDSADFTYVKWDMNRHIADAYSPHVAHQGMVAHTYIENLYEVMSRIFDPRPHILVETCSSGGNRFDLGMLAHSAMIWSSDDTDPIERLQIQQGLSYLYPPSVISAHVSAAPHAQTLRDTPLSTRFNVAAFGCLGYEYDLGLLSAAERAEVTDQIRFYLRHRDLLQFGRFRRADQPGPDQFRWQTSRPGGEIAGAAAIVGNFQRRVGAAPPPDLLPIPGLDPGTAYRVRSKPQRLFLERFGHLINHITPVRLDPRGAVIRTAGRRYALTDAAEDYHGTGALLAQGIRLTHQFSGTGYEPTTRMLGDYGSTLYVVEETP